MHAFSITSGSLAEHSPIKLFAAANLSQATGTFVFERDRATKSIEFYRGRIARARSNQLSESFGRLLVAWGAVDRQTYLKSLEMMDTGQEKHGKILVDMGAINAAQIPEYLKRQTWVRLIDSASWLGGTYRFETANTVPSSDQFPLWKVFQEGMLRRMGREPLLDADRQASASTPKRKAGMMESVIASFPDALKLYSDCDGKRTVAELGSRSTNQLLWFAGLLALQELDLVEFATAPVDVVENAFKQARKLSSSQLLGVPKGSDKKTVEKALERLQAKFSAGTHSESRFYEPLMNVLQEAAADILANQAAAGEPGRLLPQAERSFQLGRDYLERKQYEFAARKFEEALGYNPNSHEVAGYLAWTRFLERPLDQALRAKAAEALTAAARENDEDADLHAFLGAILKLSGRLVEAEDAFSQALDVDPEHAMALSELESIRMRRGQAAGKKRIDLKSIVFNAPIVIQRWVGEHSTIANFDKPEIRIGSGRQDDMLVSSAVLPQVLTAHATIFVKNAKHFIRRNGSGGVIFVNGNEMAVREELSLTAQDHIVLGSQEKGPTLEFRVFDQPFLAKLSEAAGQGKEVWVG